MEKDSITGLPRPAESPAVLPPVIDVANDHYPFCVVWTTIPLISWLLPFIGHIGICDSRGRIHDFQGDFSIGIDRMLFGRPVFYMDISQQHIPLFYAVQKGATGITQEAIDQQIEDYDAGVTRATRHFRQTQHYNFFTNNCHSFVAAGINEQVNASTSWNMVKVCIAMFLHGKSISFKRTCLAYLPFFLIVLGMIFIIA